MVVMTAKLSKKKLLGIAAAIAALVIVVSLCLKDKGAPDSAAAKNTDRLAFLSAFGYDVNGEPTETQCVRIPTEPSEVFDRYNTLQRSQGYDLSRYAGQNVTRYVYALENYDDTGIQWYASVLEADGEIIGGDVASSAPGGEMHGFERPAAHNMDSIAQIPTKEKG